MKSLFKFIGLALFLAVIVLLVGGLLVSNDYQYEQSITINQPKEIVWLNVSTFKAMDRWSPWMQMDSQMISTLTGIDGTVGAKQSWEGNKDMGSGSQEITNIDPPNRLDTKLMFHEPFERETNTYIKLLPIGTTTMVTWGFEAEIPYPFNFIMLFMNNEDAMGKAFGEGLASLKAICES